MSISVRGYGRCSTDHQVLSTEQQEEVEREAFDLYVKIRPDWQGAIWAGFFKDEDVGRESCFRERHAGSLILAASKPGDVILVANYDRIFASVIDVCETLELLREMQVRLLILDTQVDTTTDHGDFMFKILAMVKELEVKSIRRRVRDMNAHRKAKGLPTSTPPVGWKTAPYMEGGRIRKYFIKDEPARRYALHILKEVDVWKGNVQQAHQFANSLGLRQISGRPWTYGSFHRWCTAARNGFPLPNGSHDAAPIPPDALALTMTMASQDV